MDHVGVAGEGRPGDRGAPGLAAGGWPAAGGGGPDGSRCRGGAVAGLPGEQPGADEVRRVPAARAADHQQPGRVDGQADRPPRQGHREVLVGAGRRGAATTPRRLPQRRRRHATLLASPARGGNRATMLPTPRLTPYSLIACRAPALPAPGGSVILGCGPEPPWTPTCRAPTAATKP